MAGRILLFGGQAANRATLRMGLGAACYDVTELDRGADLSGLTRCETPDISIIDHDGDARGALAALGHLALRGIPVLLTAAAPSAALRIATIKAGGHGVLTKPLHEGLLMALIRRILRDRRSAAAWAQAELPPGEPVPGRPPPGRVAVIGAPQVDLPPVPSLDTDRLFEVEHLSAEEALVHCAAAQAPEAYVLAAPRGGAAAPLRLLSELRSRGAVRNARVLVALDTDASAQAFEDAAMALDLGADDVLLGRPHPAEIGLRLARLIEQRRAAERAHRALVSGARLSVQDPLTGLFNRRYALPELERLVSEAHRSGRSVAFLALDLDRFKHINDRFGHAGGDAVLVEVARRLRAALAPDDLIARSGGEEFWIVLPDADLYRARMVAQALRQAVRAQPVSLPGDAQQVPVTISIGVAVTPQPGEGPRQAPEAVSALVERADRALYAAKAGGRDTVTLAGAAA